MGRWKNGVAKRWSPERQSWRYIGHYRDRANRERTKTFDRQRDAEKWVATNKADLARGAWIDPRAGRVTLSDYASRWLANRTDIRPSTRAKYGQLLGQHIFPTLGRHHLASLSPSLVRSWHAELSGRHPAAASNAYRLLSTICRTAVNDELVAKSPCRVAGAGIDRAKERVVASVAEVEAATAAALPQWRLAILLAAWCQLRRGEVLGLQRRNIDALHGTLTVRQTWSMAGRHPVLGPPKTDAGRRSVAIPPNIVPALTAHLSTYTGPEATAWLFLGTDGNPAHPRTFDHAWATARTAIGRPDLRLHDLRHSGLTWAAAAGASVAELMRRAGHASPQAALRYQHATEDRDRAIADALGALAEQATIVAIADTADFSRTKPLAG